jgi:O-antigen ligase
LNREVLDRWCERGILGLVLAILVFGPLAFGAVDTIPFLVIQGLTLGVLVLWGARLWLNERPQFLWPPICWAVLAFTLYAIVRYKTAQIEYLARQELIQILVYSFLFLAILNNLHRQESTQLICFTVIFLAMGISFYAFYQVVTNSPHVWSVRSFYPHRGCGTYICPNNLAGLLEMLVPVALAFTLAGRLKPVLRVLLGYAALVLLVGIAVTFSRGGWFSTLIALVVFFGVLMFQRNYRLPALVFFILLVGTGTVVFPKSFVFQQRLKALFSGEGKVNDDARFTLWRPALEIAREHPWWGAGPAHFDACFPAYRPEVVQSRPDWVHNDYLNTLTDYGIVGVVLVGAAWVLLGIGVRRTWRAVRGSQSELGGRSGSNKLALVLGVSVGLLALLCHSVVDFNLHIPANAILAITLMALLTGYLRFATEQYWFSARLVTKLIATAFLLTGCFYLGTQGLLRSREAVWLRRVEKAPEFSPQRVDYLKKAFAIEPLNGDTAYTIGEIFQTRSREGSDYYPEFNGVDYRELARQGIEWLERSEKLNPLNAYAFLRHGACLDWLGKFEQASVCHEKAEKLDPNGFFTMDYIGLHYVESGDYAAAKSYFDRSIMLHPYNNPIARNWREVVVRKLLEDASQENTLNKTLNVTVAPN